ncbi:MAG: acetate kinase [Clostridia bacterium]
MKILVINAGSSSLKYQLIDMDTEEMLAKGNCEKIGLEMGIFGHKTADGRSKGYEVVMHDHTEAFQQVKMALLDEEVGVIKDLSEVTAIGHRIVQGGALFSESVLVDESVVEGIESLIPLAPLHNSAHVQGIRACLNVFGTEVPEVVVFDTAFHSTMPEKAYMFAVPYEYYEKYQIRRYGFHGTSHRYVSAKCAELMGKDIKDLKIVTCHIGNGSSVTAVDGGKVIDTSMGLTPLDGFMMGTRTGTLDPSVVTFIAEKENLTPTELSDLFNKKSGLLGISGISSDDRDVRKAELEGNKRAKLAHDMLMYQIKKFVGSYIAAMGGVDAIVFTAGLGENQAFLREGVLENMECFGVEICKEANDAARGVQGEITTSNSRVKAFVIPTNEELVIARDTKEIVEKL